jgi:hypothetical protein
MEISLAYDSTKPWGDMLYEEQQNRKLALLRMPEPEWLACVNAYFNRLRGNGPALVSALAWSQQVATERAAFQSPKPVAMAMSEDERNWRVWKDMVEEPEKYGSDIGEWTLLDEEVRRGPKRWRVDAYWYGKVREIEAGQAMAVTKIQALWRGHVARTVLGERFNCGRCLAHIACPARLEDDDLYVCRVCKGEVDAEWKALGDALEAEEEYRQWLEEYELRQEMDAEQGLGEEEVCDDCGEETVMYGAQVGELRLCPDCIHIWEVCNRCDRAKPVGGRCDNHCKECGDEMTGLGSTNDFCSGDCHYAYMRDC